MDFESFMVLHCRANAFLPLYLSVFLLSVWQVEALHISATQFGQKIQESRNFFKSVECSKLGPILKRAKS